MLSMPIVWTTPFLKRGRGKVNFNYLLWAGGGGGGKIEKKLKRGWNNGTEAGLLKMGELALLLFNFFKVYHFCIRKLFYSLRKIIFFCQHSFMKKIILSCLKMDLCVYARKVGVSDQGRRGVLCVRVGELSDIP